MRTLFNFDEVAKLMIYATEQQRLAELAKLACKEAPVNSLPAPTISAKPITSDNDVTAAELERPIAPRYYKNILSLLDQHKLTSGSYIANTSVYSLHEINKCMDYGVEVGDIEREHGQYKRVIKTKSQAPNLATMPEKAKAPKHYELVLRILKANPAGKTVGAALTLARNSKRTTWDQVKKCCMHGVEEGRIRKENQKYFFVK